MFRWVAGVAGWVVLRRGCSAGWVAGWVVVGLRGEVWTGRVAAAGRRSLGARPWRRRPLPPAVAAHPAGRHALALTVPLGPPTHHPPAMQQEEEAGGDERGGDPWGGGEHSGLDGGGGGGGPEGVRRGCVPGLARGAVPVAVGRQGRRHAGLGAPAGLQQRGPRPPRRAPTAHAPRSAGKPAVHKLRLLSQVQDVLSTKRLLGNLLDAGLLGGACVLGLPRLGTGRGRRQRLARRAAPAPAAAPTSSPPPLSPAVLKAWIEPMSDGALPNARVRETVLRLLHQLPIDCRWGWRRGGLRGRDAQAAQRSALCCTLLPIAAIPCPLPAAHPTHPCPAPTCPSLRPPVALPCPALAWRTARSS